MTPRAFEIRFTPAAAKQLRKLPIPEQAKIARAVDPLADTPRPHSVLKLEGPAGRPVLWRIRAGSDYRVIYAIDDEARIVVIARVALRGAVYDDLDLLQRAVLRTLEIDG